MLLNCGSPKNCSVVLPENLFYGTALWDLPVCLTCCSCWAMWRLTRLSSFLLPNNIKFFIVGDHAMRSVSWGSCHGPQARSCSCVLYGFLCNASNGFKDLTSYSAFSLIRTKVGKTIQGSPDNRTPLGIGKSVIQSDCYTNRPFLVQEGPFWDKKLSYKVIVILSGEHCNYNW